MSTRIRCKTIHNVEFTGVNTRRTPNPADGSDARMRTQANYETLIQIISLRALPQDITNPVFDGEHWVFDFTVQTGVYQANGSELWHLYEDCVGVPMIPVNRGDPTVLEPHKTIHFEVMPQ